MPPEAIADLLADEQIPPPPGHDTWTAAAVHQIDGQLDHQPPTAAVAPTHNTGRDDAGARNLSGRAQPPGEPPRAGRPSGDTTAGATAPTPPG